MVPYGIGYLSIKEKMKDMFGNHDQSKNTKITGVNCSVSTCSHHGTGNCCRATNIQVGTEYATDKSETFCSTYRQKPGT